MVLSKFCPDELTTLENWEAEVAQNLAGDRQNSQVSREEWLSQQAVEERTGLVLALWRNVFTATGMEVPRTAGEATDIIKTVRLVIYRLQDDIRRF